MKIKCIIDNHLYNKCCIKKHSSIDTTLEILITELRVKFPNIREKEVTEALYMLEKEKKLSISCTTKSDSTKEISLISYYVSRGL